MKVLNKNKTNLKRKQMLVRPCQIKDHQICLNKKVNQLEIKIEKISMMKVQQILN